MNNIEIKKETWAFLRNISSITFVLSLLITYIIFSYKHASFLIVVYWPLVILFLIILIISLILLITSLIRLKKLKERS